MSKNGSKIVFGTVLGLAAGYVTGLLTAPKSGKDTREQLKNSGTKVVKETELKLKTLYGDLSDTLEQATDKAASLTAKGRRELARRVGEAKKAQRKVKLTLSAIHNGDADDPDLQAAIKEAQEAKRRLVAFFKKSE